MGTGWQKSLMRRASLSWGPLLIPAAEYDQPLATFREHALCPGLFCCLQPLVRSSGWPSLRVPVLQMGIFLAQGHLVGAPRPA